MKEYPYREDRELKELLKAYENLKSGKSYSFIEEDDFERIIDYYDEKDNLEEALYAAETAIEQYPYSAQLMLRKADILIANKQYKKALDVLDSAEVLDSTDINLYILKTDAYLALDLQSLAVETLEAALQMFEGEERLQLLFDLCDVYDDYEEFDKVFDCLKLILEEDATNEEALYKICFWTDFTGRNEESIILHQQIINEHPYNSIAWFNLAAAYQSIKLYEKAIDAYQFAIAIDEKFDYAYRNMGDAYLRLRKFKDAIEVLEKVLELSRPESVIYEAIGHCYQKLKNNAQARFHYKKAVHLSPEDSKLYYKIATTYMNDGQWASAIKQLENALRIHRKVADFNLAIGKCYLELGNTKDAIYYFGVVVKAKPKNTAGWLALLSALLFSDMPEEALIQCKIAQQHLKEKPILVFYTSAVLFELGKSKEALLQLEEGMSLAPKLLKKFIELCPSILQNSQVIDVIARFKKSKKI